MSAAAGGLERLAGTRTAASISSSVSVRPGSAISGTQGELHVPLAHLLALEAVEDAHAAHERGAGPARRRHEVGRAGPLGHDDGQVAPGHRDREEVLVGWSVAGRAASRASRSRTSAATGGARSNARSTRVHLAHQARTADRP